MSAATPGPALLSDYRVVVIGNAAALFTGKLMGDLGAEVVIVEPPGGHPLRNEAPLVTWNGGPLSATWLAFATSGCSVALDLGSADGRAAVDALLDTADVVVVGGETPWIESFELTPDALRRRRPSLVAAAITPFGLTGPHAGWAGSDLVLQAAGGLAFVTGDADRPPIRISEEMVWAQGGSEAAVAIGAGLYCREVTGDGDGLDVSLQEAVANALHSSPAWWQMEQRVIMRQSSQVVGRGVHMRTLWPCKDGYVCCPVSFGAATGHRTHHLVNWMNAEGEGSDLAEVAWEYISTLELTQDDADRFSRPIAAFFRARTRAELFAGALERRVILFPVLAPIETLGSTQLAERGLFATLEDTSGSAVMLPGGFVRTVPGERRIPASPPEPGSGNLEELLSRPGPARHAPDAHREDAGGLLEGLVVCDFGWVVAGPSLSRFLAQCGATVIKIESNERLDSIRTQPPFRPKPHRNGSGVFARHNASKLSVGLNLRHPEGRAIARRLAVTTGVVNENFAPGVLDEWDLGYESLRADRPDLVMVSSSMQGQTGSQANHPGLAPTLQGLVGFCHLTGWPDREPLNPGEPFTDTFVAPFGAAAFLAALVRRARTGEGAHVDLSQFEVAVSCLAPALVHEQLSGIPHVRSGNASEWHVPEGIYPCAGEERWVAISVLDDRQWDALVEIVGFGDGVGAGLAWRQRHRAAIDDALSIWTSGRSAEAAAETLQARGVPAHLVSSNRDLMSDPQLLARGNWAERPHPLEGTWRYQLPSFRPSGRPLVVRVSPKLGEHTDQVLTTMLGMSEAEIAQARAAGALT